MHPAPPRPSDVQALLATAEQAFARGDPRAAAELARSAIDLASEAGDDAGVARARALLARVDMFTGDFESAGRLGHQVLDHAAAHGPPELVAQACSTLSFVYDRAGLSALAVQHGLRALESARAGDDRAAESLALNRLGTAVRGSEESARAIGMLEESVRLARTLPASDAAFWPMNNLAHRWIDEADRLIGVGRDPQVALQAALVVAVEAAAIARTTGKPLQRSVISANLAGIHRRLGEHGAARERFVEAIELAAAAGAAGQEATFRLALASLEVEASPSKAACAALEQALAAFPAKLEPDLPMRSRRILAQAYRTLGEPDRACEQLERLLVDTRAAAGQRADAQWRLMESREELALARHDAALARTEAELQRVRARADAELAREVARHRDRLETEVAARTLELRQALVAAEAASRAKSAFLAIVGHELRTPLNGVLGMLEIARRRATEPAQLRRLESALAAGNALAQLVEQLLAFVAEPAPGDAVSEAVDVRRLVEEQILAARPQAQPKDLAVVAEVGDDLPPVVRLDAARVRQVLRVLIGNAVKFSREGPIRIGVRRPSGTRDGDGTVVFEVADRGPGMAPDLVQRLFRPFEIGDASYTRAQGGLGLGLALVGRWVEAMGARIEVDSEPGRGSTFRVSVPVGAA